MGFIAENQFKRFIEKCKFPAFWRRSKVLAFRWEFHRINWEMILCIFHVWVFQIMMLEASFLSHYNSWPWVYYHDSCRLQLMRMCIQFVHLRPQSVVDKVAVMRRYGEVDFLSFLQVNLFLSSAFRFLIFFVVVFDNFLSFDSLHYCHQAQSLLSFNFVIIIIQKLNWSSKYSFDDKPA